MLPMTIRCNSCGNYMNAGTKLNARKEQVMEETYLGINCFRFYFRSTNCSAEIVKKTDPKNSDYVIEAGATSTRRIEEDDEQQNEEIGDDDAMLKSLENRSLELKQEMDVLANLEEIKSMKARRAATVSVDTMLEALKNKDKKRTGEEEDEAFVQSIFSVARKRRIHADDKKNDVKKFFKLETSGKQQPVEGVKFRVRKSVPSGLQSLLQYDAEDEYTVMQKYAYLEESGDDLDEEGVSLMSSGVKVAADMASMIERKERKVSGSTDHVFVGVREELEEDKRE